MTSSANTENEAGNDREEVRHLPEGCGSGCVQTRRALRSILHSLPSTDGASRPATKPMASAGSTLARPTPSWPKWSRPGTPCSLAWRALPRASPGSFAPLAGSAAALLPDLGALAWIQSRMVVHIAAVYGHDTTDRETAAELLVLQGIYDTTEPRVST